MDNNEIIPFGGGRGRGREGTGGGRLLSTAHLATRLTLSYRLFSNCVYADSPPVFFVVPSGPLLVHTLHTIIDAFMSLNRHIYFLYPPVVGKP